MKLDETRPYGRIFGGTGRAMFSQDDNDFDINGDLVTEDEQNVIFDDEPEVEEIKDEQNVIFDDEPEVEEINNDDIINEPAISEYNKLPVIQLKQILDSYGEPYLNKAQAVAFIEAQHPK